MGSDMIVALREASADGTTLLALNHHAPVHQRYSVTIVPGQMHEPGEICHVHDIAVQQARQTFTALGVQPVGRWGFSHGVNDHRVAIGVTEWQSRLPHSSPAALCGFDLVRLALQRSHGAHHAVETLTDLIEHHGPDGDNIFLIADANEAFVLETAGRYWAMLECGHTRVVTDAAMIRQDWRRLAPGLAEFATMNGWWQDDGSKIDFVRCLGDRSAMTNHAHKRWGHASLALAQQQGAIDMHFLRRMLADHHAQNRELLPAGRSSLACAFLVDLPKLDLPVVAWIAFGSPKLALHFPVCLVGELPADFGDAVAGSTSLQERVLDLQRLAQTGERANVQTAIERLQVKFDQEADDFLARAYDYANHGKPYLVSQIATEMMHGQAELFAKEYRRLLGIEEPALPSAPTAAEEVLFFA